MERCEPRSEPSSSGTLAGGTTRTRERSALGVYVHFPWCLRKCPYCDFVSYPSQTEEIPHEAYAAAVIAELGRRLDWLAERRCDAGDFELRSVFFGGGTPSLWQPASLGRVVSAVKQAFSSASELEITVECNPSSFDRQRALQLRALGVNRISLGVQSLDAGRLAFLGRLHDAAQALGAVEAAFAAGFAQVSADLIYGVAGQSASDAVDEAVRLAATGVTHLSAYMLTIEPGTSFGTRARRGRLPLLPEEEVAGSFGAVHDALTARGFEHYEISNFAKPAARARHNLGYWRAHDYFGLGCGAVGTHSFGAVRIRHQNTKLPTRYLQAFAPELARLREPALEDWVDSVETIDGPTRVRERLMLGLRLSEGVDLAEFRGELALSRDQERALTKLLGRGKLERSGDQLRIPYQHWLLADGIIAELL